MGERVNPTAPPLTPDLVTPTVATGVRRAAAARQPSLRFWATVALLMIVHVGLGVLMRRYPVLSVAHTVVIAGIGLWWSLSDRSGFRPALLCAYITGAEALWRMTGGSIVWEFGKYSIVGILGLSILRFQRWRLPALACVYLLLLLPAAAVTALSNDVATTRNLLSMNLSGPLALAVSVAFFSQVRFSPFARLKLLLGLVIPILAVAAVCLQAISEGDVFFGASSNMAASGGFGPNQVSATLGLGVLLSFFCLTQSGTPILMRLVFVACALGFAAQSALTLSRSGLYFSGLSILAVVLIQLRDVRRMIQTVSALLFLGIVGYFFIYPQIDEFTGGAISRRFENRSMTGREEIMEADVQIMLDNLPLGIGVGMAKEERGKYYRQKASHTEYTRLIAEHGVFGAAALVMMIAMAAQMIWRARGMAGRAFAVGMVAFSLLFMTGSGMRLVMSGYLFGIAGITWVHRPSFRRRQVPASTETPAASGPARPSSPDGTMEPAQG